MEKLINKNPALRRMFSNKTGETRVVGTVPTTISDELHQKEMKYTYSSLR